MKSFLIAIALLIVASSGSLAAQSIQTADQLFSQISDAYAKINDYEAQIVISSGRQTMSGTLLFKAPSLLRIDFSQPAEQAIVYDGHRLLVYLPQYRAVLAQDSGDQQSAGAGLASREGLKIMKRNYTIAWESSPAPVALDPGSQEMVRRLILSRKTVADGFKTLRLSIPVDNPIIRRIEGWTIAGERIAFTFAGITTNIGVSTDRFMFAIPATANVYNNFLFKSDN